MNEALQGYLATLGSEVESAAIPDEGKQTALWCIGKLPALYVQFGRTNESRYGDEISRLVQAVLKELSSGKNSCPAAQQLAAGIPDRLRHLHEELGLPGLRLKTPGTVSPRSRKVG
jgi:hypothetical protein